MTTPTLTLTQPKPPQAVHGTCRLTLHVNGQCYRVRPLRNDGGGRAWRLRKDDGTAYDLRETVHGPVCDCPDATFRDRPCKHVKAMRAVGLLS